MSQGEAANQSVADILLSAIPNALSVTPAHKVNDRSGVDWWVECDGHHLGVDVKVREEDWSAKPEPQRADDLALETWSVVERSVVGWTRDAAKRTDYVLWLWKDTGRWCLIPFPLLCGVFSELWEEWRETYKPPFRQHTPRWDGGYQSECIFVPRKIVWREIYQRYGGEPVVH
jgi:hypothetical protein